MADCHCIWQSPDTASFHCVGQSPAGHHNSQCESGNDEDENDDSYNSYPNHTNMNWVMEVMMSFIVAIHFNVSYIILFQC